MTNILKVDSLSANYKSSNFSIKNISFSIPNGSIVGMIGENGAGKTTILNSILGLKKKNKGVVKVFGKEFDGKDVNIKEQIGIVFDDIYLPKILTAKEVSRIYNNIYRNWDHKYFLETLEKFNILPSKKIQDYSKGMQKMFSIVMATAHYPKLLILDEPTSSLDPVKRQELLKLFQEFVENGKNSILFSSHITTDLEKISDYVIFIKDGVKVFAEETTKLVYEYGLVRCTKEDFNKISQDKMIVYQIEDYQNLVLVNNRDGIELLGSNLVVENPTLEEIMNLFSRGVVV